MSKLAKIKQIRSPNVADENNRSDTPLSRRSANTTIKPRTIPKTKPVQTLPVNSEEMLAPIAAQNVINKTRSKLIVRSGVIIVPRSDYAPAWIARAHSLRSSRHYRGKKEY